MTRKKTSRIPERTINNRTSKFSGESYAEMLLREREEKLNRETAKIRENFLFKKVPHNR